MTFAIASDGSTSYLMLVWICVTMYKKLANVFSGRKKIFMHYQWLSPSPLLAVACNCIGIKSFLWDTHHASASGLGLSCPVLEAVETKV